MKTDVVPISSDGTNIEKAFAEVDNYAEYRKLPHKDYLHLRLLAEETLGMIKEMAGIFEGEFWVEGSGNTDTIRVDGHAELDSFEREDLLALSKSGKNILVKGIMGRIKSVIEAGSLGVDDVYKLYPMGFAPDMMMFDDSLMMPVWSLNLYREGAEEFKENGEDGAAQWDELEKSIVANLADDVQVGVLDGRVKLAVIYKR